MIVRIMADNQYRIDKAHRADVAEIERLDEEMAAAVNANQDVRFHQALTHLIEHVHHAGQALPVEELMPSDLMVPAADMTVAEARAVLQTVREDAHV